MSPIKSNTIEYMRDHIGGEYVESRRQRGIHRQKSVLLNATEKENKSNRTENKLSYPENTTCCEGIHGSFRINRTYQIQPRQSCVQSMNPSGSCMVCALTCILGSNHTHRKCQSYHSRWCIPSHAPASASRQTDSTPNRCLSG
jgi:hypothetical protein